MENLASLLNSSSRIPENDTLTSYMGAIVDQSSGFDSNDPGTKRRSSSRSIKRRKFDDELVEYSSRIESNTTPTPAGSKASRTRTHSLTTPVDIQPASPATPVVRRSAGKQPGTGQSKPFAQSHRHGGRGRQKHGRHSFSSSTKDLGRWKPTDDLALAFGVLQTNDLKMVERGVKFSCRFTFQEIQQRWQALLYDQVVSRVALAAIRNLHPDMVTMVQSKALFSKLEEDLLSTIKSSENPTVENLQTLLNNHPQSFYPSRTAKSLLNHWQLMKHYQLLPDQTVQPQRSDLVLQFSEAEELVSDTELGDARDEAQERDLAKADRRAKKEIRSLEAELTRWQVLVDSVTGISPPDFDNQTLAVLRGRLVRYLMRSREITVGRCTKDHNVDIDLSLEGPAGKVSRRQGTIRLRNNGDFFLSSEGRRAFYVDGRPILHGDKHKLNHNSVVEIAGLRFIFLVNQDLIGVIRHEAAKLNLQP